MRSFLFFLVAFLTCSLGLQAQNGRLSGVVVDSATGEFLTGAAVRVIAKDKLKGGAVADERGEFTITQLKPGVYDIKISFVGYASQRKYGVKFNSGQAIRLNFSLHQDSSEYVEICECCCCPVRPRSTVEMPTAVRTTNASIATDPGRNMIYMDNYSAESESWFSNSAEIFTQDAGTFFQQRNRVKLIRTWSE